MKMIDYGKRAKIAQKEFYQVKQSFKREILIKVAEELVKNTKEIINANQIDLENAKNKNMNQALLDRLLLNEERIQSMATGLKQVADLDDPIGSVLEMKKRPNGLLIGKKVVPIGVIGIIYEARPNVTIDAFGLCFKTNNTVILRGGSEAINTNRILVDVVRSVLENKKVNPDVVQIITDTSREIAIELMRLNEYLDVLIPRGGKGLINAVIKNATVPVIETGNGNCHLYIDEFADITKAIDISYNAKVQRPGVCNACETILVHQKVAKEFLQMLSHTFSGVVEVFGDEQTQSIINYAKPATEEDYYKEYHDHIIAIKVVENIMEAIDHIEKYSTKHSEAIITEHYDNANLFLDLVDSAAVYVNASTRFTDGFEFGFGAEIGISTQKLHARGPMGLKELTTTKYIIYGNGQIRE